MARKSTPRALLLAPEFRRRLMRWFRRKGRDLPWRRSRDPYHIVVSEFMLQQTQVSRVEAYYQRFLTSYPTIHALASAHPAAVRESWDGLGYYRRAANLHRLAQDVVRDRDGIIPSDPAELCRLPGVGRYTAGAVASFAYERATPAVDTNVARVLRRAFHPRLKRTAAEHRLWETAERIMPRGGAAAWTFNQAIMELGALICTARVARCGECPVRAVCVTGRRDDGTGDEVGITVGAGSRPPLFPRNAAITTSRRPAVPSSRRHPPCATIIPASSAASASTPTIELTSRWRERSSSK